jgi:hypothetical protein
MIEGFCGITFNAGQTMGFWLAFVSNSSFHGMPVVSSVYQRALVIKGGPVMGRAGPCGYIGVVAGILV